MQIKLLNGLQYWTSNIYFRNNEIAVEVEGRTDSAENALGDISKFLLSIKCRDGVLNQENISPSFTYIEKKSFRSEFVFEIQNNVVSKNKNNFILDLFLHSEQGEIRLKAPYSMERFKLPGTDIDCIPYTTVHKNASIKVGQSLGDAELKHRTIGDASSVFTSHFKSNRWGNAESISGNGSSIEYTQGLRKALPMLFKKFDIESVLDAPCGDYNWFKEIRPSLNANYLGADIVEDLIKSNNDLYSDPRTKFVQMNIIEDNVDKFDIIICRDCLFHLPNEANFKVLNNFCNSGSKYLLTTSHYECSKNTDISIGDFRKINLLIGPYLLPEPMEKIDDYISGFAPRYLGLWKIEDLKLALSKNKQFQSAISK